MGVGVSSLRLRKAVVLRAYNLRQGDETLEEQFRKYAFRGADGRLYISLIEVKECLRFAELTWADEMLKRLMGESVVSDLLFSDFVEFLETGRPPTLLRTSSESSFAPQTDLDTSSDRLSRSQSASGPLESTTARKADKGTAGRGERAPAPGRRSRSKDLPPHPPPQPQQQQQTGVIVGVAELVPSEKAPDLELVIHPKDSAFARLSPSSSVWRKRELVRQERTVQYTTIDADGLLQELVEKETSETEVLHMESRETGEFAHRETTVYEQKETFNDEVVAEQHGSEEYVHLKSLEDEFEYMESTMPNKNGPNGEGAGAGAGAGDEGRPPISPRPAQGEGDGGDGGDGGGFWSSHEQGAEGGHGFEYSEEGLDEEAIAFLRYQEQQREFERHSAGSGCGQRRGGDVGEGQEDQDLELELELEMMEQMLKQQQQRQQYRGEDAGAGAEAGAEAGAGEGAGAGAGVGAEWGGEQREISANWSEPGPTSRSSGAEQAEGMRDQGLEVAVEVPAPEVHPPPSSSSSSSSSFVDID